MTKPNSSRKRTLSEYEDDEMENNDNITNKDEPPRKKQKTSLHSVLKKRKQAKEKGITIYYQISDYTQKQISNILSYTSIKRKDRPILLFADNDIDNFWLRNKNKKNASTRRQQRIYDKEDSNTSLIAKYDNFNDADYLSHGVITDYIAAANKNNKKALKSYKQFKKNIDASFDILAKMIKQNEVKWVIIPSKFPLSKNNKFEIFHRLKSGKSMKKKHLLYIQSKINQFEKQYAKQYIFSEEPVLWNEDGPINNNQIIHTFEKTPDCNQQRESENKKSVRFKDETTEIEKLKKEMAAMPVLEKEKASSTTKKNASQKPKLCIQPTLEITDEASVGNESPSPLSSRSYQSFPSNSTKYENRFKFPISPSQRSDILKSAQYTPTISFQQYQATKENETKQREIDNIMALRQWQNEKIWNLKGMQAVNAIKLASTNPTLSIMEYSSSPSRSMSPFDFQFDPFRYTKHQKTVRNEDYVQLWSFVINCVIGISAICVFWMLFNVFYDSKPLHPPFHTNSDQMTLARNAMYILFPTLFIFILLCIPWMFCRKVSNPFLFSIFWIFLAFVAGKGMIGIMDESISVPMDKYNHFDDEFYANLYNNKRYDPISSKFARANSDNTVYKPLQVETDEQMEQDSEVMIFGGHLWMQYGINVLLWIVFSCLLYLCFEPKISVIFTLTLAVFVLINTFWFIEDIILKPFGVSYMEMMHWLLPISLLCVCGIPFIRWMEVSDVIVSNVSYVQMIKCVLMMFVLFWIYYDAIYAIQIMLVLGFVSVLCNYLFCCVDATRMRLKEQKKKKRKEKRRQRKRRRQSEVFNPYDKKSVEREWRKSNNRRYKSHRYLQKRQRHYMTF